MMSPSVWKANILETVKYIANKPLQKKGWFEVCDDSSHPDELYDWLFDDDDIEGFLNEKSLGLTNKQIIAGKELIHEMIAYDEKNSGSLDPRVVIKDPEWDKVVLAAQNFYKALTNQKNTILKSPKIREELINAMKTLSDLNYQEEGWVNNNLPNGRHDTFDQRIHFLYDDNLYADDINAEIGDTIKNENEAKVVSDVIYEIDTIFKIYGKNLTDKEYINLPEWKNVLSSARKAYQYLNTDDN